MRYTDGLIEARIDSQRNRYDEDRLLDGFGDGLDDDTALLALGRIEPTP
jgi:hypothetical protein